MTQPRVTLHLHEHYATSGDKAAYLLSVDGDEIRARWVPKALCEKLKDGTFSIERWKAVQEGLLTPPSVTQGRLAL